MALITPVVSALPVDKPAVPHAVADYDEKSDIETPSAGSLNEELTVDWTSAEEARVVRKLDFYLLALLCTGFFVFQIERGCELSIVVTRIQLTAGTQKHRQRHHEHIIQDLNVDQNTFNAAQGVLFAGIVTFEIPSNIVLLRVGPQIWLTFQVFAFGLVATLQMFIKNAGGLYATRLLLGIAECGYIPGSLYFLSMFYKRSELGFRHSIFFVGSGLAQAVTGLLAYGILRLTGKAGLAGWQWLFLIEGLFAVGCGFLFLLLIPASPDKPTPLFFPNFPLWTARDRHILSRRVIVDDTAKGGSHRKITGREVWEAVSNKRVWPHLLFILASSTAVAATFAYGPLLVRQFGFDVLKANALSSVQGWIGLILTLVLGYVSDRTRIRGPLVLGGVTLFWIFYIAFVSKSLSTDRWLKFGLITALLSCTTFYRISRHSAWVSLNCKTPQQRSITMAMFIMAANTAGAVGSQILRKDDAPLYKRGFKVCVGLLSFALVVIYSQHFWYRISNKKIEKRLAAGEETDEEGLPLRKWVI